MNLFKNFKKIHNNYTVAQIHNEFDSSTDRLLNEAKEIVSKVINTSNGERLIKLGFKSSKEAVESENILEIKNLKESLCKRIEYFKQWYPFNKYITGEEIRRLCEKYNLIFGEVRKYKGEVPEKNIKELELFVLREEDKNKYGYFKKSINDENCWEPCDKEDYLGTYGYLDNKIWTMREPIHSDDFQFHKSGTNNIGYANNILMICAPEKDFDTNNMSISDGYKLVDDPIVFQPVNGGYLIISKWGLEASDKIVSNEKDN